MSWVFENILEPLCSVYCLFVEHIYLFIYLFFCLLQ